MVQRTLLVASVILWMIVSAGPALVVADTAGDHLQVEKSPTSISEKTRVQGNSASIIPKKSLSNQEENSVDLSQDRLVVGSGETVVISGRNTSTPTDFTVRNGGTLIIRDSNLFRTGEHHNDNEDVIEGKLIIRNTTIRGENWIPIEISTDESSIIKIYNSNLKRWLHKKTGTTTYFRGSKLVIHNSTFGAISAFYSPDHVSEISVKDSKIDKVLFTFKNFEDQLYVRNLNKNISNLEVSLDGSPLQFSNTTIVKPPGFISRGSDNTRDLQPIKLINSTARVTIFPGSKITAVDSTVINPNLKFIGSLKRTNFRFENLRNSGSFKEHEVINKPYLKLHLINSNIPEMYNLENVQMAWGGLAINSPGEGRSARVKEDFLINNSSLYSLKIGHNLSANNVKANRLSLYNNYGGVIVANNASFNRLRIVQGANVSISGNLSFSNGVHNFGDLSYFEIKRAYPIQIKSSDNIGTTPINITLQNPSGEVIWEKQGLDAPATITTEIEFGMDNYKKDFELEIIQGEFTKTRSLSLTSDTPIKISLDDDQTEDDDEDGSSDDSSSNSTHHGDPFVVGGSGAYSQIQRAVTVAKAHQSVIVHPGKYEEQIKIFQPVVLRSVSKTTNNTVIDAANSGGAISLFADGTVVDGFTFVNPEHAHGSVRFISNDSIVSNSSFRHRGHHFVFGKSSHNNSIFLNEFQTSANFFYLGDRRPRHNHWNTTRPRTYWYKGSKWTSKMGNFYPDYEGVDTDGDGIGETPYRVGPNNVDYFPLVDPPSAYSFTPPGEAQSSHSNQTTTESPEMNESTHTPTTPSLSAETTDQTTTSGQQGGGFGILAVTIALVISLLALRRQ